MLRLIVRRVILLLSLALLFLGAAILPAGAEEARNLASACTFSASRGSTRRFDALYDHDYGRYWQAGRAKNNYLEVHLPEGEVCSGVQIKWAAINPNWCVEVEQDGAWVSVGGYEADYLTTWTPLPEVSVFRISSHNRVANYLRINELVVLSSGDLPAEIQIWQPTWEKADLLVVVGHPDDEYIFLGAVIPYYGAERGKRVLVAYITESSIGRRTELLDGLWAAGQRTYPLVGRFHDRYTLSMEVAYQRLGKNSTRKYMIELFRHYKPEVVVTHDINGEYGHGVHKVCADIVINALKKSSDPKVDKASAQTYGLWDVPKCYIHLYGQDQIRFNWQQMPLSAFGGRTAYEVADAAWHCHLSQQHTEYKVFVEGPYDSQLFGLYRSLVGPDELHQDFFENLE